jgi:hypothetical protein
LVSIKRRLQRLVRKPVLDPHKFSAPRETWQHLVDEAPGSTRVKIYVSGKEETISLASFREIVTQSIIEATAGAVARIILAEWKKRKARQNAEQEDQP